MLRGRVGSAVTLGVVRNLKEPSEPAPSFGPPGTVPEVLSEFSVVIEVVLIRVELDSYGPSKAAHNPAGGFTCMCSQCLCVMNVLICKAHTYL